MLIQLLEGDFIGRIINLGSERIRKTEEEEKKKRQRRVIKKRRERKSREDKRKKFGPKREFFSVRTSFNQPTIIPPEDCCCQTVQGKQVLCICKGGEYLILGLVLRSSSHFTDLIGAYTFDQLSSQGRESMYC